MADISNVYQIYDNSGNGVAASYVNSNAYKNVINQADVGREQIVKIVSNSTINNAELNAAIATLTLAGGDGTGSDVGGPDAFTVAAVGTATGAAFVSGTTDTVFLRVQGTGTLSTSAVKSAAEGATGGGSGTFTVTVEAVFTPAL